MNTLNRIMHALGRPQAVREMRSNSRIQAAVARWRHQGGFVDLREADAFQLVFNLSGGQVVELHSGGSFVRRSVRAGSIAIVSPIETEGVKIIGQADTLQILLTRELVESVPGSLKSSVPPLVQCEFQLQAAAIQALVALNQNQLRSTFEVDAIVNKIAFLLRQPDALPGGSAQGGLSPGARRRVYAFLDNQLDSAPDSRLSLGKLAAAAGLSVHHFIKAFRQSEGETPYARVLTRRLDRALMLLLQVNARIDQVADETGFSSPSHFVSTFRKRVGVTPGAFREAAYCFER